MLGILSPDVTINRLKRHFPERTKSPMRPLLFNLCNYRGWNLVISMVGILFLKSCISHYSTPNTVPDPIVTLKSVFVFIHKLFFFNCFKSSSDHPVREAELEAGLSLQQKAKPKTLLQESLQGRELLQDPGPGFLQNPQWMVLLSICFCTDWGIAKVTEFLPQEAYLRCISMGYVSKSKSL